MGKLKTISVYALSFFCYMTLWATITASMFGLVYLTKPDGISDLFLNVGCFAAIGGLVCVTIGTKAINEILEVKFKLKPKKYF